MKGIFPEISSIENPESHAGKDTDGKDTEESKTGTAERGIDFSSGFYIIPSISIQDGYVCFCEDGRYVYPRDKKGRHLDPLTFIEKFETYPAVCLIDINGISSNSQQLGLIEQIRSEADNEIWVDGGIRRADDLFELGVKGADRILLGTKTIERLEEYQKALDIFENIIPSIDIYMGKVSSISEEIASLSIGRVINMLLQMGYRIFCISDLGRDKSVFLENREITEAVKRGMPFFLNSEFEPEDGPNIKAMGFRGMMIKTRGFWKGVVR